MVSLKFASWNRIAEWLRRLDARRHVARPSLVRLHDFHACLT